MLPAGIRFFRSRFKSFFLLLSAGVLIALIIRPWQDYFVLDDWATAWSVENFLLTVKVEFMDWSSHYFFTSLFWGALFCLPTGFSLGALHLATYSLALLGLWSFYLLLKELDIAEKPAWLATFLMGALPPFFLLSMSFMTEVPFWALIQMTLFCYVVGQKKQREDLIWLGVIFNLLAFFIKQYGITPALALLVYRMLHRRRQYVDFVEILPILTFATLAATGYLITKTVFGTGAAPTLQPMVLFEYYSGYLSDVFYKSVRGALNISLFLFPLSFALFKREKVIKYLWGIALVGTLGVIGQWQQFVFPDPIPPSHVFNLLELGQSRGYISGDFRTRTVPFEAFFIVLGLAMVSAGILLVTIAETINQYRKFISDVHFIVYLHTFLLAIMMALLWVFSDRYYIWLMPGLILLCLRNLQMSNARLLFGFAASALWMVISITGTLDHISHQKQLLHAYNDLKVKGNPTTIIDAGYTINGWYAYAHPENLPPGSPPRQNVHSVTGVNDNPYWILSKSDIPGYQVYKVYPLRRNFWSSSSDVNLLQFKIEVKPPEIEKKKKKKKKSLNAR
ncbi:MAG: glycosyltransferase family 39 protein [Verrucomicrobiota bacterium]|nr:glycosyltransferase family 39 protein [Verrucomicrobiota bacterium]